jgi:hypothetical protein
VRYKLLVVAVLIGCQCFGGTRALAQQSAASTRSISPGFTAMLDRAARDERWNEYDRLIEREVADYNRRLADTPGYQPVDWRLIKAMVWIESGGPTNPAWRTRPIQIGNPGDPGLAALRTGEGAAQVILRDAMKRELAQSENDPERNVRLGIAYLMIRMAETELRREPAALGRPPRLRRIITGWRPFDAPTIAARYNGGGDSNYAAKLDSALAAINNAAR